MNATLTALPSYKSKSIVARNQGEDTGATQKALLLGIMSKHTGQPLEVIERDSDRDYYLEAKQAVDYGLVDQVLEVPEKVK